MNEYEMFKKASGFELRTSQWDALVLYVFVGDEADVIEQIEIMAGEYPEPENAEVGFVVLYHFLNQMKN